MITAGWYLQIYQNSRDKDGAIGRICADFLRQTSLEIKKIHANSENILVQEIRKVIGQQDKKWREFAALVRVVRPEGYEILLQRRAPGLFSVLRRNGTP